MGMCGNYISLDEATLNEVIAGDVNILNIDDSVYPILDIDKSWHAI